MPGALPLLDVWKRLLTFQDDWIFVRFRDDLIGTGFRRHSTFQVAFLVAVGSADKTLPQAVIMIRPADQLRP